MILLHVTILINLQFKYLFLSNIFSYSLQSFTSYQTNYSIIKSRSNQVGSKWIRSESKPQPPRVKDLLILGDKDIHALYVAAPRRDRLGEFGDDPHHILPTIKEIDEGGRRGRQCDRLRRGSPDSGRRGCRWRGKREFRGSRLPLSSRFDPKGPCSLARSLSLSLTKRRLE